MADGGANKKQEAIKAHRELVNKGNLEAARRIFDLLLHGCATLGLNDDDWYAECALERAGLQGSISRRGLSYFRIV